MASIVALIPARYESTRLPGKPLADIHGKPMIQHVYERACAAGIATRVIVATDDARVAAAVRDCGGEVAMTRADHPSGTDRIAEVAAGLDAEIIVNVQGDLPFLQADVLRAAVQLMLDDPGLPMSTVKTAIRTEAEMHNPNAVKVVTDRDGFALYFSRSPVPCWRDGMVSGADAVLGYKHIGLYVYRRDFLVTFAALPPTPLERAEKLEQLRALESGYRIRVAETAAGLGVEVDTPEDLQRARRLGSE